MSLVYNDTDTYKGIVQEYEREVGYEYGDISNNTLKLKALTVSVNLALDAYWRIAIDASGTFKLDDSNHERAPEILFDLVSGQRSYQILSDQNGNKILEYDKVYVADSTGVFHLVHPVDQDTQTVDPSFYNGQSVSGQPTEYDKRGNEIIFNFTPNYSYTNGIKASVKREASYFQYTDTTKSPGVPGHHHAWFYLKPAEDYARRNGLASYRDIQNALFLLEKDIKTHFSNRTSDEKPRIIPMYQNNK